MKSRSSKPAGKHESKAPASRPISIRAAEKTDAAALAGLMGELGYPTRTAEMEMRLDSILKNRNYRTLVAVSGGKVCGMIGTCWLYTHEHNNPGGRVIALVVSESARGRGVGRELVQAAEKDFLARNITRIALNTRLQREDAHRFYEQLGYTKNGFRFVKELQGLSD